MVLARLLRFIRYLSTAFFYNFGLHCARNQIRVIIISDIVITSLLYPALAIYFSSQPLSHYSTRLHDSLFALNSNTAAYRTDLRDIWEGYDSIRIKEDAGTQARCGAERTIRLERILFPNTEPGHPFGALNKDTIYSMYQLKSRIDGTLGKYKKDLPCITTQNSECLAAGPLLHLPESQIRAARDDDIISAINMQRNKSRTGVYFEPETTLAGRGSVDTKGWIYEADLLVLTYFFIEDDCHANLRHSAWLQVLNEAASGSADVTYLTAQPKLVALKYDLEPPRSRMSLISAMLYCAYIVVFIHFSGSLRRMDSIHSRFGIAFTGIVEILASTVTSVSVCALWGFRVTMVPWGILPVLIVFVGAEHMFSLVQEVVSTPIILPVKERIGIGLSRAGTSNTFKCVLYNAIFGTLAVFSSGAIRQFCIFTVVVLVAHWFLIHTFFVAVLAIDLYRLDLADLIRQGPNITPSALDPRQIEEMVKSELRKKSVNSTPFRRGRAARNGSLILMFAITAGLYYASYPFPASTREIPMKPSPDAARESFLESHANSQAADGHVPIPVRPAGTRSASWVFWETFNPDKGSLLHLRIESPSIITFRQNTASGDEAHRLNQTHLAPKLSRTLRPLIWTVKVIVLPMSCTALALYALMRYLLKDADLSDAQDGRLEASPLDGTESASDDKQAAIGAGTPFVVLPRAFAADVELGVASRDGSVIAAVSVENQVILWLREQGTQQAINLTLLIGAGGHDGLPVAATVSSIALDDQGDRCAIGMEDGLVIAWKISEGFKSRSFVRQSRSRVSNILFLPSLSVKPTPPGSPSSPGPSKPTSFIEPGGLLVTHENGEAFTWSGTDRGLPRALMTSSPRLAFEPVVALAEDKSVKVGFALEGGLIEVLSRGLDGDNSAERWKSQSRIELGDSDDSVTRMTLGSFSVGPAHRDLVAVATRSGRVTVWNCEDGCLVASLEDVYGEVEALRLAPRPWRACPHCGDMGVDEFTLAVSIGPTVLVHRAIIPLQPNRCSCPMSQALLAAATRNSLRDSKFIRSRSGSMVSASASAASSPSAHRIGLPPLSSANQSLSAADYPVPGHGYHSRRISEKDVKDRSRSSMDTQSDGTDQLDGEFVIKDPFAVQSLGGSLTPLTKTTWNNLRVNLVATISCDRGDWDVAGSTIMGIRRKSRIQPKNSNPTLLIQQGSGRQHPSAEGTSPFTRWELWTFDPEERLVRASTLASLEAQQESSSTFLRVPTLDKRNGSSAIPAGSSTLTQRHQSLKRLMDIKSATDALSNESAGDRTYPRLPFTRVNFVAPSDQTLLAGFGNTIGFFDLHSYRSNLNTPSSSRPRTLSSSIADKKTL